MDKARAPRYSKQNIPKASVEHIGNDVLIFISSSKFIRKALTICVDAGSKYDANGLEGQAHMLEHILLNNVAPASTMHKRNSRREIAGMDINAVTMPDSIFFYQTQLCEDEKMISGCEELFADLQIKQIKPSKISEEKRVILDELGTKEEGGKYAAYMRLGKALYEDDPSVRPVIGTKKSIGTLSRKDILSFYEKNFSRPMIFALALEKQPSQKQKTAIIKRIEALRGILPKEPVLGQQPSSDTTMLADTSSKTYEKASETASTETAVQIVARAENRAEHIFIKDSKADNATITIGLRIPGLNRRGTVPYNGILKNYLANTWSSILIRILRLDKNITYWVEGDTYYFDKKGILRFTFSVSHMHIPQALKLVNKEFGALRKGHLDSEVFEAAKSIHIDAVYEDAFDALDICQSYSYDMLIGGNVQPIDEYLEAASQISETDFSKYASDLFANTTIVVIVRGEEGCGYFLGCNVGNTI